MQYGTEINYENFVNMYKIGTWMCDFFPYKRIDIKLPLLYAYKGYK